MYPGQYGQPQYPPQTGQYPPQTGQYPGQPTGQYPGQQPYGATGPGFNPSAPTSSPSLNPYNPSNPYGPSQTSPYGQQPGQPSPYGQQPGQPSPYGQQLGQPYGQQNPNQYPPQTQNHWAQAYSNNIPPEYMQQYQAWFQSVDRDKSGTITAFELSTLDITGRPLGLEVAKKLIRVFDKNHSGSVDFNEYVNLHQFVRKMIVAFQQADQDRTGFLDAREIYNALIAAGFQMTFPTIEAICKKYDTPQSPGRVSLDGFITICAHLASVRSIFEWNDQQRSGKVILSYDQLSHITIHLMDRPADYQNGPLPPQF